MPSEDAGRPSELPPPAAPAAPAPAPPLWQPGVPGIDATDHGPDPRGGPTRLSPVTMLSAVVSAVFGLLLFGIQTAAATAVSGGRSTGVDTYGLLVLFLVIVNPAFITLRWWVTTYAVDDRELVLDTGLLTRKRKVVPFARLQQIDLHQKLFDQIVNTATLQIDTAGEAGQSKLRLGLLSAPDARALREFALRRRAELHATTATAVDGAVAAAPTVSPAPTPAPTQPPAPLVTPVPGAPRWGEPPATMPPAVPVPPTAPTRGEATGPRGEAPPFALDQHAVPGGWQQPEREVLRLGPGRLLVAALTHHVVVGAVPVVLLGWVWVAAVRAAAGGDGSSAAAPGGVGVAMVLITGFVATMLAIGTVVGQYGYTIAEAGDDLHLRYGLLEVRNVTVPRRRVQHLTVTDNPVRRALGLVSVTLHTATLGAGNAQTRFEIPILHRRDLEPVVRELLGRADWALPELTPRPDAARRRAVTRRCLLLAAVVAVPALLLRPFGPVLFGIALVGMPWGMVAHRRAGHGELGRYVALSRGVLHHRVDVVPIDRVQSCHAERNPLQRWSGLASFHIDVAGALRSVHLYDMAADACTAAVHELPLRSAPDAGVAPA